MSSSEARQQRINEVVSTYQRYPGDTGSTEVQGVLSVLLHRASSITYEPVSPPKCITLLSTCQEAALPVLCVLFFLKHTSFLCSCDPDSQDLSHGRAHESTQKGLLIPAVSPLSLPLCLYLLLG